MLPNFSIGRRSFGLIMDGTPKTAPSGQLVLRGVTQFATDCNDANDIARQHKQDFDGMVDSQELLRVTHEEFPQVDGYYTLVDVELDPDSPWIVHPLVLTLQRVGSANDVKFETRLVG